ncbi:MAG: cyclic nucleotide-binding domain-containing protein, partial [Bacteroidota bacterium]|nr:cyclic nucleotide-binding domain-containing protein [Bacteroidota bacterium]
MKDIVDSENCLTCMNMSSCFKVLNDDQLSEISQNRVSLNFKKGDIIAKQGAYATHIMFIKSGLVKLYKEGDSGQNGLII